MTFQVFGIDLISAKGAYVIRFWSFTSQSGWAIRNGEEVGDVQLKGLLSALPHHRRGIVGF